MIAKVEYTREEFESMMEEDYMKSTGYFLVHQALVVKLGFDLACFLCGLIRFHHRVMKSPKYKWKEGWFYYTAQTMKNEYIIPGEYDRNGDPVSMMPERTQTRWLSALTRPSYSIDGQTPIEIKRKGMPPKRHIRINTWWVKKVIKDWQSVREEQLERQNDFKNSIKPNSANDSRFKEGESGRNILKKKEDLRKEAQHAPKGACRARTEFDLFGEQDTVKQGCELWSIWILKNDDLIYTGRRKHSYRKAVTKQTAIKMIRVLKEDRKATNEQIWKFLKWYKEAYDDRYTRRIKTADPDAIAVHWHDYLLAMKRWEEDQRRPKVDSNGQIKLISDERAKRVSATMDDWGKLTDEQLARKKQVSRIASRARYLMLEDYPDINILNAWITKEYMVKAAKLLGLPEDLTDEREVNMCNG